MSPPKQLKIMDAVKTRNKDRRKDKQDGGDTPGLSDDQSDAESISSKLSDSMITERSLHRMLQDLRSTIRKDFLQIDSELRKEITTLGERTSHLENKSDELLVSPLPGCHIDITIPCFMSRSNRIRKPFACRTHPLALVTR
ncbi:Hypothetical predicted protein [Pelobates cultripes]|uniref:Uncharacterized protein n=1 Tax=Pelobates cultripes TaxID=61616 RepID=A0AAD1W4B8_PELCU|nr:Hypothetical predicted protein [Pelobates cultripes]